MEKGYEINPNKSIDFSAIINFLKQDNNNMKVIFENFDQTGLGIIDSEQFNKFVYNALKIQEERNNFNNRPA